MARKSEMQQHPVDAAEADATPQPRHVQAVHPTEAAADAVVVAAGAEVAAEAAADPRHA